MPGCGKNQYVKALPLAYGWNMLIVNHRESLKGLSDQHTAVFFSFYDMSFEGVEETNDDRDLRVLL